ncbi:Arm DNA-binding domain-containing protein, partial [Rhodococcus sp. CX]|uniref:site-specific integrase n=1 Tax=Rhodococcus sp. CX TaxID=2789880 RepID=UPI0018CDC2C5
MKGSIYKRCTCPVERDSKGRRKACKKAHGSWTFVADLGIDPATGKRRQIRKSGFRTSDDAQEELNKFLTSVATGQAAHDNRLTVGDYLRQWLETKEAAGIRPTTLRSYRQHIDAYLIPHLGRLRLGDLRATHVEKMLHDIAQPPAKPKSDEKIAKGKRRNPKTLSPATVRRVHATLRSALTSAKRKHLVGHNAAENLELPRAVRPKVVPWEPEELGKFLDHAATDRLGALYEVMAMTGLRRGEAAGLRWDDVDLTRGVITVRQQIVEVDGTGVECPFCRGEHRQYRFGRPKTASGEHR